MNDCEEKLLEAEEEIRRLKDSLESRDRFIHDTFGRYLTSEVLEEILSGKTQVQIGGERRVVTIMFADLRQSTMLSEIMDPVDFISMLNHFLAGMIEIVNAWQGNILEFVGDAIVAVFGAPRVNDYAARDAAACAVAMQRLMPRVNEWNVQQGCMAQWLGPDFSSRKSPWASASTPARRSLETSAPRPAPNTI